MRKLSSLIVAVVLLAGCSALSDGPSVATASGSSNREMAAPAADPDERARQFVACMRANGIVLDESAGAARGGRIILPSGSGNASAAMEKCRIYLPDGGEPSRLSPEDIERARLYAKCMRDNGVPDYPDPDPATGETKLTEALGAKLKSDPKLGPAADACRNLAVQPGGAATPGVGIGS